MVQHGAEYGTGAVFQDFAYTLTLWVIGVVGLFTGSAVVDVLDTLIKSTPTTEPAPQTVDSRRQQLERINRQLTEVLATLKG